MRTRRGVERHPTGDSDILSEMMYQSASLREPQRRRPPKVDKVNNDEEEEEGTIKTQQESCDEEDIVAAAAAVIDEENEPKKKKEGPIRTRRGVQRKSTGDSDQLGLMLYGMANPSRRCVDASDASADVPTEISLSSTDTAAPSTTGTTEPRRRGRRKVTSKAVDDSSEHVDDSTNNDGN
jgi:hypothetical protein